MPLVTVSCKFGLNVRRLHGGPPYNAPKRSDHKDSFNENEQEMYLPNLHIMARLIQLIERYIRYKKQFSKFRLNNNAKALKN